MPYVPKEFYDASNPRDAAVRKAVDFVNQGKVVPLLNVLSSLCSVGFAKDQEVAKAVEHAVSFVLDHGTKEDIRVAERCLRGNVHNQSNMCFKGIGISQTLLGQTSETLLKDERFEKARLSLASSASSCVSDRYKPIEP